MRLFFLPRICFLGIIIVLSRDQVHHPNSVNPSLRFDLRKTFQSINVQPNHLKISGYPWLDGRGCWCINGEYRGNGLWLTHIKTQFILPST